MKLRGALIAGTALLGGLAWLPLTSAALHRAIPATTPPSLAMPYPAYYYWRDYRHAPAIAHWLPVCGVASAAVSFSPSLLAVFWRPRRRIGTAKPGEPVPEPERAKSKMHGEARWMTQEEALKTFPAGGDPDHGGIVIGQAEDGTLLTDPCTQGAGHWMVRSGPGGGKTASVTVPTLDPNPGWRGPCLVLDPAGELSHMTRGMREAAGHKVVVLKPGEPGFNALDWIDIADPMASIHTSAMVDLIGKERPKDSTADPMWRDASKFLQDAIMLDMLWDSTLPASKKTLATFAQRVATPEHEMRGLLEQINIESSSPMARYRAGQVMSSPTKTFGGYYLQAQTDVGWLLEAPYASMVSGGPMRSDELTRRGVTVYVEIPMSVLRRQAEVGRTVVNALLQAIYRSEGQIAQQVLMIMEDANLLGRMLALEDARDNARKFGVSLLMIQQASGQIVDTWGVGGKSSWEEGLRGLICIGIQNGQAAKEVSERCGTFTGIAYTESNSRGRSGGAHGAGNRSRNEGMSYVPVPLIRPHEVQQLKGRIVFVGQDQRDEKPTPPLLCGHPFWYRQAPMVARVRTSPFRRAPKAA